MKKKILLDFEKFNKDGFIEILELQIQGKRKMTSFEFINGYKKLDKQQLN